MPNTMGALIHYTLEHGGNYPSQGIPPIRALEVFYPYYLGVELAGVSGDRREVLRRLQNGQALDERVTSWVYWPGLRSDDDPDLALIWERAEGITVNGHRSDGHPVGFVDGSMRQISSGEWVDFTRRQAELRQRVLSGRSAGRAAQKQPE